MSDEKNTHDDTLDGNVEKLLSRTERALEMPEEGKRRVLGRLLDKKAEPAPMRGRRPRMSRTVRAIVGTAAASLVVLLLVTFWPGGTEGGVVWADVARILDDVKTVTGLMTSMVVDPTGRKQVLHSRIYEKDPGMSRMELLAGPGATDAAAPVPLQPPDGEQSVVLLVRSDERATRTQLFPAQRQAMRVVHLASGKSEGRPPSPGLRMVADSWKRMAAITADQTREIGRETIDGEPAVGFEAPLHLLFADPAVAPGRGTVRIWASEDTAAPVRLETEYRDPSGVLHTIRIDDLEWNVPLGDELFETPDLPGWEVRETTVHSRGFDRTSLRPDVRLGIGPPDGEAVITANDVAAVTGGQSERVTGEPAPRRVLLGLRLTEEAGERLEEYSTAHRGEAVEVAFDEAPPYQIQIGGVLRTEVQVDIASLGVTLEEFERDYLE